MLELKASQKSSMMTDIQEILKLIKELKTQQKVTINDVQELVNILKKVKFLSTFNSLCR